MKYLRNLLALMAAVSLLGGCTKTPAPPEVTTQAVQTAQSTEAPEAAETNPQTNAETTDGTDGAAHSDAGAAEPAVETAGGLVKTGSLELDYAENFSVDYFAGGYQLITISDGRRFLTVPEGMEVPAQEEDVVILQLPLTDILISSTPTMSLINALGQVDKVSMTTTELDSWYIDPVKEAMEKGDLAFVGSYKAPDYEMITADLPPFAVFSTMLSSVPEVEEKLSELGVPILLDQSTYEDHPLGRTEWIKLYGALFGREEEAKKLFDEQAAFVERVTADESTKKTAAIFYITSKGDLYARNGGDYVVKMLELAGGEYILADLNPDKSGTQKMEMEQFYDGASRADYIIYIWNLGGKPETVADLIEKNELLAEFKAVKEGNVWCTTPDFFQISNTLGSMIVDMNQVLNAEEGTDAFTYLYRLK